MMKKTLFVIVPFLIIIAGCSSVAFTYSKPGVTEQEKAQDAYQCRRESTYQASNAQVNPYGGSASSGNKVDINMAIACLQARGYTIKR
jgi:uncharacterized protein YceK